MLAKLKSALAWIRALFTKGTTEMTDIATSVEKAVEAALSTVESDVTAVVEAATATAAASTTTQATTTATVDPDAFAAKIKDVADKLGLSLPSQWAQVVAVAKVL